jgi:type I restriction enzyme M protein
LQSLKQRRGVDLKDALKQGTEYAEALECPLVFAMNGAYCETRFIPNGKELILNKNEVRELIREVECLEFIKNNTNEVCTIPEEILVSREELIKSFKNLNDILRGEGLRAGIERFSEFANILFLKLMSENGKKSWWNSIKQQNDDDIIGYINGYVINQIQGEYGGDVFTPLLIKNPKTIRNIINKLDPLVLSKIDFDLKGEAFEYFLEQTTSTENDLGEYFTPRHIVKSIVNIVDPKFGETVYDPFCGTGGFLTESFKYIKDYTVIKNKEQEYTLKHSTIYGREITQNARIAKMNMVLQGDGHSGVEQIDTLANPNLIESEIILEKESKEYNEKSKEFLEKYKSDNFTINTTENEKNIKYEVVRKFDIVITNMPFSQKTDNGNLYYNGLAKKNGDAICVLHCLQALKQGGRMALVVPEGFLFRKDIAKVREFLLSKCKLQSVISLPQGTFLPYTGVKTDILYFTNAHEQNNQKSYWYFDIKNIGYTLDNHRKKIKGKNDLNKLAESDFKRAEKNDDIKENMLEIGFEVVDLENVKKNDWNLVGSLYREVISGKKYDIVKLKDIIFDIKDGGTPPRKNDDSDKYFGGDINWCVVKDIKPEIFDTNEKLTELGLKNCSAKIWETDSIIISLGATIGNVGIAKKPTATKQGLSGIVVDKTKVLPKYLYYILVASKEDIRNMATGATILEVRPTRLINTLKIPLPSLKEQQKIIDEIEKQEKEKEQLKQRINEIDSNIKNNISEIWK